MTDCCPLQGSFHDSVQRASVVASMSRQTRNTGECPHPLWLGKSSRDFVGFFAHGPTNVVGPKRCRRSPTSTCSSTASYICIFIYMLTGSPVVATYHCLHETKTAGSPCLHLDTMRVLLTRQNAVDEGQAFFIIKTPRGV